VSQQNNKAKKKQKGFIGAIGDDLPSLVPIFFSLLIFFATLSFVFITINERNTYIEKYFESISVSKEILGSSFFSGYGDFESKIFNISTPENFATGLVYSPDLLIYDNYLDKDLFVNLFVDDTNSIEYQLPYFDPIMEYKDYYCTVEKQKCETAYDKQAFFYTNQNELDLEKIFKNNTPFQYLYPVSLSTSKGVINVYLYVLVW
jgi:hypothetical protein